MLVVLLRLFALFGSVSGRLSSCSLVLFVQFGLTREIVTRLVSELLNHCVGLRVKYPGLLVEEAQQKLEVHSVIDEHAVLYEGLLLILVLFEALPGELFESLNADTIQLRIVYHFTAETLIIKKAQELFPRYALLALVVKFFGELLQLLHVLLIVRPQLHDAREVLDELANLDTFRLWVARRIGLAADVLFDWLAITGYLYHFWRILRELLLNFGQIDQSEVERVRLWAVVRHEQLKLRQIVGLLLLFFELSLFFFGEFSGWLLDNLGLLARTFRLLYGTVTASIGLL